MAGSAVSTMRISQASREPGRGWPRPCRAEVPRAALKHLASHPTTWGRPGPPVHHKLSPSPAWPGAAHPHRPPSTEWCQGARTQVLGFSRKHPGHHLGRPHWDNGLRVSLQREQECLSQGTTLPGGCGTLGTHLSPAGPSRTQGLLLRELRVLPGMKSFPWIRLTPRAPCPRVPLADPEPAPCPPKAM